MTAERFAYALGMTESRGDPEAWGDAGQAVGRFQIHPAWLWDHTQWPEAKPDLDETWDHWIERLVRIFFNAWPGIPPVELAMWFHKGHRVQFDDPEWDKTYAARFMAFALGGEKG